MNPNHEEALFALALEKLAEKRPHFWTPCAKAIRHCAPASTRCSPRASDLNRCQPRRPKPPALPSSSTSLTLRRRPAGTSPKPAPS